MLRLRSLFIGLAAALMPAVVVAEAAPEKPNVILFLADDMGYGDCGTYNPESKIKTPHIDQLAKEGVKFVDAHSASNTCTPSRYGLLTGINPARTGVRNTLLGKGKPIIYEGEATLANLFRDNGYITKMIGKWHLGFVMTKSGKEYDFDYSKPILGGPADRGFDYFYGLHGSHGGKPRFYFRDRGVVAEPDAGGVAPGFVEEEASPNFCKDAVEIIRTHAASSEGKPLFLYYASLLPHKPWVPTEKWKGKSGLGLYADFMMQLDDVFGQIHAALKETGLDKNTILIFTSDNGPGPPAVKEMKKVDHSSSGILRGQKASAYEGGHRIPMIVKWPGRIEPGSISKTTLNHTDFFATFAELLGADMAKEYAPSPVDSHSFLTALLKPSERFPRPTMVNATHAIREGDLKLVSKGGRNKDAAKMKASSFKLFNLADDVSEDNDLAETNPEKKNALFGQYMKFAGERKLK